MITVKVDYLIRILQSAKTDYVKIEVDEKNNKLHIYSHDEKITKDEDFNLNDMIA